MQGAHLPDCDEMKSPGCGGNHVVVAPLSRLRRTVASRGKSAFLGRGVIIHEMLHALGLFHEHSRSDRGEFVNVLRVDRNYALASTAGSAAFGALDSMDRSQSRLHQYSYSSVMHYFFDDLMSLKSPRSFPSDATVLYCTAGSTASSTVPIDIDDKLLKSIVGQRVDITIYDRFRLGVLYQTGYEHASKSWALIDLWATEMCTQLDDVGYSDCYLSETSGTTLCGWCAINCANKQFPGPSITDLHLNAPRKDSVWMGSVCKCKRCKRLKG
jgi:hypothetical protein